MDQHRESSKSYGTSGELGRGSRGGRSCFQIFYNREAGQPTSNDSYKLAALENLS